MLGKKISYSLGRSAPSANFAHFVESTVMPNVLKLTPKVKYNDYSFSTWAALIGLCSKGYFLEHMDSLLGSLQTLIYSTELALPSILQIVWVYLNRHTEAWANMGRKIEDLCKTLISSDFKRCSPSAMIEILSLVFLKMPRIALNIIVLPKLKELIDDWERKLMLVSTVRNCLSLFCHPSKYNVYPIDTGTFLCAPTDLLTDDLNVDILGSFDSREFFDQFQKTLAKMLVSIVQTNWTTSVLDPRDETHFELSYTLCQLCQEILVFCPLPHGDNVGELCDALIKITFCSSLQESTARYFSNIHKYPLLWLETLSRGFGIFLNLCEALVDKRKLVVEVLKWLLAQRLLLDENINLPIAIMQRTAALLLISGDCSDAVNHIYPFDLPPENELFDASFQEDLHKRLLRLYYHVIAKKEVKINSYTILERYFLFLLNNAAEGQFKLKKSKRSSWSFDSISKLSLENGSTPPELYTLLIPCLEHENPSVRSMTLSILSKVPLTHIPLIISCMEDTLERCSEELRNIKYKPVKSSTKSDSVKVAISKWIITTIDRLIQDASKLEESFVHLAQKHLLEVFYFESEIDIEVALPELRVEFYRLIQSLFTLDRTFPRKSAIFPYKLQTELFSHLRAWFTSKLTLLTPSETKEHEDELLRTMYCLCDGLLSPSASLRNECMSVNSVFSWIDEVSHRQGEKDAIERALLLLLQNGAIIDQVIDRCYHSGATIFSNVLTQYQKQMNDDPKLEELRVRISLALICNK